MSQRGIVESEVHQVLDNPATCLPAGGKCTKVTGRVHRGILGVVYEQKKSGINIVVTAYWIDKK